MIYSNDFEKPHYLVITSVPESNKDFDRGDFDFTDPHGFKLNSVEKEFYKANDISVDEAFGSACDPHLAMDLEHENEPANNDRFQIGHSFTQYRCTFRGAAKKALQEHAVCGIPQAKLLLQIRPKWGITFQMYAVSKADTVYELLSLDYSYNSYTEFNNDIDMLNDKLVNLDWHAYADQVYDRRAEWLLENYYNQRKWKCNLLLGLNTHYTPITSLK